jgi:hypothetical protein
MNAIDQWEAEEAAKQMAIVRREDAAFAALPEEERVRSLKKSATCWKHLLKSKKATRTTTMIDMNKYKHKPDTLIGRLRLFIRKKSVLSSFTVTQLVRAVVDNDPVLAQA